MRRQQETIRSEMKKITDDVQLLTTQLNDAKLLNKDMLIEMEMGVKDEINSKLKRLLDKLALYLNKCRVKPNYRYNYRNLGSFTGADKCSKEKCLCNTRGY